MNIFLPYSKAPIVSTGYFSEIGSSISASSLVWIGVHWLPTTLRILFSGSSVVGSRTIALCVVGTYISSDSMYANVGAVNILKSTST